MSVQTMLHAFEALDDSDAWLHQLQNEQERREYEDWLDDYELESKRLREDFDVDMTQYAGSESKYLKASDLSGTRPRVTITAVNLLEFDDEDKGKHSKPTLKFDGKEKQLVLNATNCEELIRAFGKDSDAWIGKSVGLSTKYYKAFDREGIVVTPIVESDPDDDIPF